MKEDDIELSTFSPLKNFTKRLTTNRMAPQQKEFKTKLKFDPSKLSTGILKKYLKNLLNDVTVDELLSGDAPEEYTKDPDNLTNYNVLKELGTISVTDWKNNLDANSDNIEELYLEDDMMLQDSRYYYECWKVIQEEIGNHEKQMGFFRLVSEIVRDLSSRNLVELTYEDQMFSSRNHEMDAIMKDKTVPKTPIRPLPQIPENPENVIQLEQVEQMTMPAMDFTNVVETVCETTTKKYVDVEVPKIFIDEKKSTEPEETKALLESSDNATTGSEQWSLNFD